MASASPQLRQPSQTTLNLDSIQRLVSSFIQRGAAREQAPASNWRLRGRIPQIKLCRRPLPGTTVAGHLVVERRALGGRMFGTLSTIRSVRTLDQGIVDEEVLSPLGHFTVVSTIDVRPTLKPIHLLAVAAAVNDIDPLYSLLGRNCYWYAMTVLEYVRRHSSNPPAVHDNLGLFPGAWFTDYQNDLPMVKTRADIQLEAISIKLEIAVAQERKKAAEEIEVCHTIVIFWTLIDSSSHYS
ncbi:hypothetical protein FB451DRAFT_1185285 [Mycena latifolia]|nr:hypothetical protein FB451DRAFT_1185285 [Mycena latifolia]